MKDTKFEIQDNQYEFPYHYLAFMDGNTPQIKRSLGWGIEYLTYMAVVLDEIKQLPHDSILDVGCGDGYMLNHLENSADKLGIDLSERAIKFANAFSKDSKFEVMDVLSLSKEYDLISLIEVLEHIPNDFIGEFITKILSLIKKGGYFIISVPTTVLPLNKKHFRHYDEGLLSMHIEGFGDVEMLKDIRVYREPVLSKFFLRLLNNRLWSINSKKLMKIFWLKHLKNNFLANKKTGYHLIRIYKKC